MQQPLKLFMLMLGCKPKGRHTEQHDIFFSVGKTLKDLVADIIHFWPEAKGSIHVDAWREVTVVDGWQISIIPNDGVNIALEKGSNKLFFLNMGGYKENEFDEFHYKMLSVCADKGLAIQQAKQTVFYKHTGYKSAESHIDDKYGIDVDDMYAIEDILAPILKEKYRIHIAATGATYTDQLHLGYFQLHKL